MDNGNNKKCGFLEEIDWFTLYNKSLAELTSVSSILRDTLYHLDPIII